MLSIIGFLIILGPLVIVHEFGHYFFARLFGVKAEIFSIGFGPKLWSRQMGETELRVSAIPLGGYVKLLGEDRESPLPPEEAKRALHRADPWKRLLIFFGGPLFNFLWAILVFMTILAVGEPQTANVIGRVVTGSPAAKAGLLSGDRVLSVEGVPVRRYDEIMNKVGEHPGKPVKMEVLHPGSQNPVFVTVTPTSQKGYSVYGEATAVGEIEGMMPLARGAVVGISDPSSAAAKAGLKTGDQILEVNGAPIKTWEELETLYEGAAGGATFRFKMKPKAAGSVYEATFSKLVTGGEARMGSAWGLHSTELFVERAVAKSPAESAGIQNGDRLVAVDDQRVESFMALREAVQKSGEKLGKIPLKWEREGKVISESLTPTATTGKDPEMKTTTQFTVGVVPMIVLAEPETVIERIWNPITLVAKGTERMVVFTWRNFVSVAKMFTGDVSVGTLGGPILIGKIAGESLTHGLVAFLTTMAILSIGLGVLNILPVPVLDGGHIVLLAVESVRGKPLSVRQMEVVQGVGLVLILALMGVVIKNDISRLSSF